MKALVPLILALQAHASPLFKNQVSSKPGGEMQNAELDGFTGHFLHLHATAKPRPGDVSVSSGINSHHSVGTGLASLPATAAGSLLKFDPSFFLRGADPENELAAALEAELAAQATHPVPSTTFSYALCGPQATASMAFDALTAATGEAYHTVRSCQLELMRYTFLFKNGI